MYPTPAVDDHYIDASGELQAINPEVVQHVQSLIGDAPAEGGPVIVRAGAEVGRATVVLEAGDSIDIAGRLPDAVPLGYHRIIDERGDRMLIVTPGACHLRPGWRAWGWAAQLYASRSTNSWGMGDLGDLDRLARWATEGGAGFVLVNPLHAAAPGQPQESSPYSPTSRRFRNPLYLDVGSVGAVAGTPQIADELADLARLGRQLNADRIIDRDRVMHLKLDALRRVWDAAAQSDASWRADFDGWFAASGSTVAQFALWCALAEVHGSNWRDWPAALRRPDSAEVARFAGKHDAQIRFHAWLQWLLDTQVDRASQSIAMVQDLPIGFDAGGADAWCWQDLLAEGVRIGAPPDEFNSDGQDWGLPPFVPWKLTHADYGPFIETLRSTMLVNGGLRIDHVMGLFRLWWIPEGAGPADGAYVRYPADDLLDIVALESVRHRAVVIGEDLGTVEPGVRDRLAERNVLSYRLLWFEEDRPERWPVQALAAVTTHDLPTIAGLWQGSDAEALRDLDMDPHQDSTDAIRRRLCEQAGLDADAGVETAVEGAYALIATAPSVMLCAALDDAFADPERPNIPGASNRRPNWSIALPAPIDDLSSRPLAAAIAERFNAALDDARAVIAYTQPGSARPHR